MTPERQWGVRVLERADAGEPVAPEGIASLLAAEPARGLFALECATFDPAVPAAAVRTILSDAFRDARIAPETKAELLWRYNHEPAFRDAVLADCKGGIPFFLLDSEEGRRWYCECGLPGYETVRCSSPVFFSNVKWRVPFKWDEDAQYFGNTEFNQRVKSSDVLQDVSRQLMQLNATQMDGRVSYDPKDIRRIARDIKEAYGSSVSLEDLTANLTSVYTSLASAWNDAEVQSAVNALASLAYDVVEKVEVQGEEDDAAAEIRRSLRGQRLYASSTVRAEAKYRYGSYLNYRNMLRRAGITLTTDTSARPMDSWWAEMAEAYPSYFEAGIAEGDMVTRLAQVYDETRPRMVSAYDANEGSQLGTLDDAANDLALGMWQNYFNLEGTWTPTARDQTEGQARLNRAATAPRTSSDLNAIAQEKRAARAESELEAARAETAQARQEAREARAEANRAQMETNRQVNEATSRLRQQLRQEQANRQNAETTARCCITSFTGSAAWRIKPLIRMTCFYCRSR